MTGTGQNTLSPSVQTDRWSVVIYLALVAIGWLNIFATVYDGSQTGLLDLGTRYGMQAVWIGISLTLAVVIMLMDGKYYHILAYPAYWAAILVLVAVLFLGREINGARSWIFLGPVAIQPAELVKFTTALALARYMSRYNFSISRLSDIAGALCIILLPVAIIFLQNDTGSALVYGAFLIVFFREGLNGWIFIAVAMLLLLFVFSFLLTPFAITATLILLCVIGEGMRNGRWKTKIIYLASVALGAIAVYGFGFISGSHLSMYASLLASTTVSLVFVITYAFRQRLRSIYIYIALFAGSLVFTSTVDYIFNNVMQVHQQQRVLHLLGLENDLEKWGYNVNQSKIAIGSGGFLGKGFLEGTQTKYKFVPEQSTDFIFSTLGEEWGFAGCAVVLALFCLLILRLIKMGEKQRDPFGRIYCYGVASMFLFHVAVNIGMTIGLMPVIGIPLPFFSYGGSSMIAFTLMFFIALKLDSRAAG